jgi:pyruvate/2-oxoglutarate dehydrogenase complex dihydrolipoamide dehydrogenase (E3) component
MQQKRNRVEEFTLNGDEVVAKVKELIEEGNVRRLIIRTEEGRTLLEIPLTIGVVGGVIGVALAPVLAAIGALAALVTRLSIVVERAEPGDASQPESSQPTDEAL